MGLKLMLSTSSRLSLISKSSGSSDLVQRFNIASANQNSGKRRVLDLLISLSISCHRVTVQHHIVGGVMSYVDLLHSCHVSDFTASRVCPITHVTRIFGLLVEAMLPEHSVPVTYVTFY